MRKRFKIKNLIRNNRYTFLSRGEERNLLPNAVRLKISGGGWTSPLLYSWGSLKKYGARLMCASNEPTPTRISKFASSLRNSALPLGEGQTKSGGHSPLLHTGYPRKRNGARYIPSPPGEKVAEGRMRGQSGTLKYHNDPSPEFLSSRSSLRNSTLPLTKTIHRNVFVRQSPRGEE